LKDFKELYDRGKNRGGRGDLYSKVALDHFKYPRNVGVIEDADVYARVGDSSCGDFLEIYLKLKLQEIDPEKSIITDVKFRVFGCPGAIVTSSIATELVKGNDVAFALSLSDDDVIEALGGLPEGKEHCSLMSVHAIRTALSDIVKRD
jgi:nitrogen fixation protein NifU and related proteins